MNYKRNKDYSLRNLVVEFENMHEAGQNPIFDEGTFFKLIDYYEKELFFDKALQVIDCALEQFGFSSDLHIKKAQLLLMTRDSEKAMSILDKAQIIAPAEIEVQLLKSKVLASMERYSEALDIINALKESTCSDHNLSSIYYSESTVYEIMRDFEKMYSVLSQSLFHNPMNEKALEKVWVCSELTRKFEDSIVLHKQIIDRTPYNFLAWYNLGQAYSCVGFYDEAIEAYEYSFIVNSDFEEGYKECAELCFDVQQYAKALNYYMEALDVFGPCNELYASVGLCYLKLEDYATAQKFLRKSLKLDPYNDEVHYHLGLCKFYQNKLQEAKKSLEKAIEIEDRREEYYLYLAKVYWNLGDLVKADYCFAMSSEIGPEQVDGWKEHAFFLFSNNSLDRAYEIVEEGIVHAMDFQLYFIKSALLFSLGQRDEAYITLRETLIDTVENVELLYLFCPAMRHDKITQDMIKYYEKEVNAAF